MLNILNSFQQQKQPPKKSPPTNSKFSTSIRISLHSILNKFVVYQIFISKQSLCYSYFKKEVIYKINIQYSIHQTTKKNKKQNLQPKNTKPAFNTQKKPFYFCCIFQCIQNTQIQYCQQQYCYYFSNINCQKTNSKIDCQIIIFFNLIIKSATQKINTQFHQISKITTNFNCVTYSKMISQILRKLPKKIQDTKRNLHSCNDPSQKQNQTFKFQKFE
eukprot:TRINITY_DN4061_c1_g1_i1.p1 TRINITY_DN4061_c1_g1~~TRINITY_DN4061_c1_g1_i1.p1  ORF type:complete len:226 (+),score=1.07 TRINITY_DN4061_c1_g1_i1:30-680(+)